MRRRGFLEGAFALAAQTTWASGCRSRPENEASFWHSLGGRPRNVLLSLVDAFHHAYPEHRIAPVYQGDYFETLGKLRTAIHAGMAPALVHVVGEAVPYLADAGAIERLDELPELGDDFDLVPQLTEAALFPTGRPAGIHALPFNRSTPIAYVNLPAFEKAGLGPPGTWEELRETARALTIGSRSEKRFGFACAIDWWFWAALVAQAGGDVYADDGTATLGGEAGERGLALWQALIADDVMRPPPGRDFDAWQVVNSDFIEGRAAMVWTSTAYLRYFEDNAKFPFATAPLPADKRRGVPTGGTFFVMPRGVSARRQRAAAAFLAFMMQPDQANRFATETGYIPASNAGLRLLETNGYFDTHPNARVAIDQLAFARGFPWKRSLLRIEREIVQPHLEEAVVTGRSAHEALEEARRAAREDP